MNAEPPGFDRAALVEALREWDLSITALRYLPVGAGSHHYLATDSFDNQWFVTVDVLEWKLYGTFGPTFEPWVDIDLESGLDGLDRAFRTAVALRDGGLEFVHAPITRPDGGVLARLGRDHAVSVFPLIEGASHSHDDQDRPRLLEAVGRLHAATHTVPSELPRRDSLTVPIRSRLFGSLDDLTSPWNDGPYGDSARQLLRDKESLIRDLFHRADELADEVREAKTPWVITHGQLHAANILRGKPGAPILIDWDCLAIAPRERDLGMHWGGLAKPKTPEDWAAYTSVGQEAGINPAAVNLYWHIGVLWDVCVSTGALRSRHVDNADTRHMWTMLQAALSAAAEKTPWTTPEGFGPEDAIQ
jgi:spectinomycin phosphotransferase